MGNRKPVVPVITQFEANKISYPVVKMALSRWLDPEDARSTLIPDRRPTFCRSWETFCFDLGINEKRFDEATQRFIEASTATELSKRMTFSEAEIILFPALLNVNIAVP